MTAILRQKCCKDGYGNPKCIEGACDDCDDCEEPWDGGCVATSQSSKKKYKVIYNGPASGYPDFTGSAKCIYVLQLLEEDGQYIDDPIFINEENFEKNYVDVGECPGVCYGPVDACIQRETDDTIFRVVHVSAARDVPDIYDVQGIVGNYEPHECVWVLFDTGQGVGSQNLLSYDLISEDDFNGITMDGGIDQWSPAECPQHPACPEYRCLEFTDNGPNHGRKARVDLINQWDTPGAAWGNYACVYGLSPEDNKGPFDEADKNHPNNPVNIGRNQSLNPLFPTGATEGDGWWVDFGQWSGGYNYCCDEFGAVKYTGSNGEELDEVYLHYVANEDDIAGNRQRLTSIKFVWEYNGCYYRRETVEKPDEGLPDEYIQGYGSESNFKVVFEDLTDPRIGLREYNVVNPHPHVPPDEHCIVFGWAPADFTGKPWKYYRWGGRMLILSENFTFEGNQGVNLQETPDLQPRWADLIKADHTKVEEITILNLCEALETLLVDIRVEDKYTGTDFPDANILGLYGFHTGILFAFLGEIMRQYPDPTAALNVALKAITHESIHALQDMAVGGVGDAKGVPIGIAITPEGVAEATAAPGYYHLEVEAHSNDDDVLDSLDILELLREEINNYYGR